MPPIPNETLQQSLDALVDAAERARWDAALDAAVTSRAAIDQLVAADPALGVDFWISQEAQDRLAAATTKAVEAGRLDVAVRLLDAAPDGGLERELEEGREALRALQAGDPELALAVLAPSVVSYAQRPHIQRLHERVAERTALALDVGTWEQRMLGVLATGLTVGDDSDHAHQERLRRQAAWAGARNLHWNGDLLAFVAATVCVRRDTPRFEACAMRYESALFPVSRSLFDQVLAAARRRVDAGDWGRALYVIALAAFLDDQQGELNDLIAGLGEVSSSRARLLSRTVDDARERIEEWRRTESERRRFELPRLSSAETLGTFELASGIVTVGDPGYSKESLKFHVPILGVKPGTWLATVVRDQTPDRGIRCAYLLAHHVDEPCALEESVWLYQGSIDVEYATAGIFHCPQYYDESVIPAPPDDPREGEHPWYDMCLTAAHGRPGRYDGRGAGTVPFGCVSASGRGDGSYDCFVARAEDRTAIAICIDFRLVDGEE